MDLTGKCLHRQQKQTTENIDTSKLTECLLDSKIFSDVRVKVNSNNLSIKVVERRTLIPIPFVRSQKYSTSVGGFLLESNFLGLGKQLVLGGTLGNHNNSLFLLYKDPAVRFSDWTLLFMYRNTNQDLLQYSGGQEINGYQEHINLARITLGRKIKSVWELSWSLEYASKQNEKLDPYQLVPDNYSYFVSGPGFEYEDTHFKFYFQEGQKVHLDWLKQLHRSDENKKADTFRATYDWQLNPVRDHAVQIHMNAQVTNTNDVRDILKVGGRLGLRGVETNGLWVDRYATFSLDYKVPVWKGSFGTWTAGPFLDYARLRLWNESSYNSMTSFGGELLLYLRKIAFPGIGIIVGRNPDYLGNFASLSIGFGF